MTEDDQYNLPDAGADAASALGTYPSGLNVQLTLVEDSVKAIASGGTDVTIGSPNRIIGGIDKGLPVTIIGPTINAWDQYLIVSNKKKAATAADLKGARFGISTFGSAGDYATVTLAKSLHWTPSDYKKVSLGSLKGLQAGIKSGAIDAFLWSAFPAYTLQFKHQARVLGSVKDLIGPNSLDILAVTNDFLKRNPGAVRQFCTGFYAANKKMQDPSISVPLLEKWGKEPSITPEIVKNEAPLLATSGAFTDAQLSGMAEATKATIKGSGSVTLDQVKKMYRNCDDI